MTIEHDHKNSEFSDERWSISVAMLAFTKVEAYHILHVYMYVDAIHTPGDPCVRLEFALGNWTLPILGIELFRTVFFMLSPPFKSPCHGKTIKRFQ